MPCQYNLMNQQLLTIASTHVKHIFSSIKGDVVGVGLVIQPSFKATADYLSEHLSASFHQQQ